MATESKPAAAGAVPYGKAAGLFAASVATLVGVVRNVSPEVVLWRAVVAGLVCGLVVRVLVASLRRLARVLDS